MTKNITVLHDLGCAIPCVKVETIDHSEMGYLVPFRAYRFQVCSNTRGDGDLGSSDVIRFNDTIRWMPKLDAINWLREQAIIALMRWSDSCKYGPTMSDEDTEIFEAFIHECYDWVMSH